MAEFGPQPEVVNEQLIRECIRLAGERDADREGQQEMLEEKRRTLPFSKVDTLLFSYRHIVKIDNLLGLTSLTKLQLDNNDITKIENLDHLVNLTWLDLSFNKITKIEGLSTLTKLTDLSLFCNDIEVVENLDGLTELQIVSLGNNAIKDLEYTMYLRRFNKLRMVNLAGNPICKDPEYRSYVLSHIKNLRYLDYRLVDEAAINTAKEQYQDEMLEIEEKEAAEEAREKLEAEKASHLALMEEANLEGVETLFEDMLRDDPEHAKLSIVPDLQIGLADFREAFNVNTEEFRTLILDQHEKKKAEHTEWLATVHKATGAKDAEARNLVMEFERTKKVTFRELKEDPGQTEVRLEPLRMHNEDLQDRLLGLEMQTVEILNELCGEFDRNYSEIVDENVGHINNYFGVIRDQENVYFESLQEAAGKLLEQFLAGELDEAGDNVRAILQDKDTFLNAMQASHDAHTSKIDALEDKRVNEEKRRGNALVAQKREWEAKRNRERISEIWSLIERNADEMNEVLAG